MSAQPLTLLVVSMLIVGITFPWRGATGHAHWSRIGWIPFVSWPLRPLDVIANLVLFTPFGAASAFAIERRPVLRAGLLALLLSSAVEFIQVFSHTRFPSATDVACNVIGAVLGAHVTSRIRSTP